MSTPPRVVDQVTVHFEQRLGKMTFAYYPYLWHDNAKYIAQRPVAYGSEHHLRVIRGF